MHFLWHGKTCIVDHNKMNDSVVCRLVIRICFMETNEITNCIFLTFQLVLNVLFTSKLANLLNLHY